MSPQEGEYRYMGAKNKNPRRDKGVNCGPYGIRNTKTGVHKSWGRPRIGGR